MKKIELLLTKEAIELFNKYKGNYNSKLVFELSKQKSVPHDLLMEQILAYRKAKSKLPSLAQHNLLYTKIALEQSSGEAAAKFKASLFSGDKIIDLTGGLGIDCYYFSKNFNEVTYCEINDDLYHIVKHNFKKLSVTNINLVNEDSTVFLRNKGDKYDYIYIDPARRDEKQRSVDLNFCQPNVIQLKDFYFNYTNNIIVKISPGFEVKEAIKLFKELKKVYVISVSNECKEIILQLEKGFSGTPVIYAVGLRKDSGVRFKLSTTLSNANNKKLSTSKKYFYEPDSAIIKAGLSCSIAEDYDIYYLNRDVDYLTSDALIKSFPGRSFKVSATIPFNKKTIKKYLKEKSISKANLSKRGFKYSVAELRKIFNLKDGGSDYLFFTKDLMDKPILIAAKRTED